MRIPKGFVDRTLKDAYENNGTIIHFIPYIPRPSNLYGETLGKTYGNPIPAVGYLEMNPTTLRLRDLGWDLEGVDLLARFPFRTLVDVGLANEDGTVNFTMDYKIGVPVFNKEYQLYEYQLREPFVNGQPTYVYIVARKFVDGR